MLFYLFPKKILLGHFIKHKPSISEEFLVIFLPTKKSFQNSLMHMCVYYFLFQSCCCDFVTPYMTSGVQEYNKAHSTYIVLYTKWKFRAASNFQTAKRALISRRQQAPKNWTSAASFEFRAFWRKKSSWPARNWVKISQGKSASKEGWEQLLKILCAIVAFFAMVSFFFFFLIFTGK